MKLPFTIYDLRFAIGGKTPATTAVPRGAAVNRQSSIVNRKSASGIALVITLIMLSVTLIMAVAFLALSRRERSAVATTTDTAAARLAADSALAAAQAQIAANLFLTNQNGGYAGAYDYHLLVSTNYINPAGYVPNVNNPTNVNYDYRNGGGPLLAADLINNIANLYYLPRVPVYVKTNSGSPLDFRFYLDLNRNGQFEANGWGPEIDGTGATNGSAFHVGDPEWIGVLERPDQPHGPNNRFVARYAFLAQPSGNGLDLNYIHNQTFNPNLTTADGFFRNEGVGSWELNLAAFLADLNTNQWNPPTAWNAANNPYIYTSGGLGGNSGFAFEDARALLAYRYANNYNSLAIPSVAAYAALVNNGIDGYAVGALMTGTALPGTLNPPTQHWVGSDNTNRFFSLPTDLFDRTKTQPGIISPVQGFTDRLTNAGAALATYDRYTFYRLLDQLGTDSTADDGRMNLNYDNLDPYIYTIAGVTYTNAPSETNFMAWTPLEFFTNAANRLLTNSTTAWLAADSNAYVATFNVASVFGVTGIPVLVSNQFVYSPAVNRLLQLAANVYDATTSSPWPSVFRPLFSRVGTNVFITGYTNLDWVTGTNDPAFYPPLDVSVVATGGGTNVLENVYGVPWILGAKKGLPNFNEFSMINNLAVTRRLQFIRTSTNAPAPTQVDYSKYRTNQMYMMNLSSALGVELWNSYSSSYSGQLQIVVNEAASLTITNDDPGFQNHPGIAQPMIFSTNVFIITTNWQGSTPWYAGNPNSGSFILPLNVSLPMMTNSVYRSPFAGLTPGAVPLGMTAPCLIPTNYFGITNLSFSTPPLLFESNSPNGFHLPQFGVLLTNRLQCYILAETNGLYRVIDYVHFAGPDGGFNVNSNLADPDLGSPNTGVWNTNYPPGSSPPNGPTWGIINQINVSKSVSGTPPTQDGNWHADPQALPLGGQISQQTAFCAAFFLPGNKFGNAINTLLSMQAPYSPTRNIVQYLTWQANDPLVHYLASDIDYSFSPDTITIPKPGVNHYNYSPNNTAVETIQALTNLNLGKLNDRYLPWGGNPRWTTVDTNPYAMALKDPLATSSDAWNFPTNKFPTPGWLGRVHRGTPWQTVYLKATNLLAATGGASIWTNWLGNANLFDASNAAPVFDSQLFDLFGTAPNGNATHGTLSVNQDNFAAWSAVFGGLVVPTNTSGGYAIFPPAGASGSNSYLGQIVAGINATRANTNLFPSGVFTRVGDVLRTPPLTEQSPFLSGLDSTTGVSDELYEWLPQQTLGLLRVSGTPRYVVYCYGQSLRPAANSIVTGSGSNFGLCTNYQIMAESAARAVIRLDRNVFTNAAGGLGTNYSSTVESFNVLPPD